MKKYLSAVYSMLIFATVVDIILLIYVTFFNVTPTFKSDVYTLDLIICILLWIEFIYNFLRSDKKQYLKENAISVLGMLPFNAMFLRSLRVIKLIQLSKILVISVHNVESVSKFLKETYLDKIMFVAIIFIRF